MKYLQRNFSSRVCKVRTGGPGKYHWYEEALAECNSEMKHQMELLTRLVDGQKTSGVPLLASQIDWHRKIKVIMYVNSNHMHWAIRVMRIILNHILALVIVVLGGYQYPLQCHVIVNSWLNLKRPWPLPAF